MKKICKYCKQPIRVNDSWGTKDEKEWWHIDCKYEKKQMKKKLFICDCGCGLSWVEFKEKGCPAKKEDYFLTEDEILEIAEKIKAKRKEK